VFDRVEVVETVWTNGLPAEHSRRLLALLFAASPEERNTAESGEIDSDEEDAA
jgi:hypothetical protein